MLDAVVTTATGHPCWQLVGVYQQAILRHLHYSEAADWTVAIADAGQARYLQRSVCRLHSRRCPSKQWGP